MWACGLNGIQVPVKFKFYNKGFSLSFFVQFCYNGGPHSQYLLSKQILYDQYDLLFSISSYFMVHLNYGKSENQNHMKTKGSTVNKDQKYNR